jgi:hypothetical protein
MDNKLDKVKINLIMNKFTEAQVIEHSQLVMRGAKPCSVLPVKYLNADYALELSKQQNCKAFIKETDDENWCEIWMYKRDEMRGIIENLPEKPETKIEHFILGCAFGYSIDSILDYVGSMG